MTSPLPNSPSMLYACKQALGSTTLMESGFTLNFFQTFFSPSVKCILRFFITRLDFKLVFSKLTDLKTQRLGWDRWSWNPRYLLVSGFKSINSNWKRKYFLFPNGVAWPLWMSMTDPVPISSEYIEDEQRSLSLIYLDYSRDLPPYVSKNTTEASLLSSTIKSFRPSPQFDWVFFQLFHSLCRFRLPICP